MLDRGRPVARLTGFTATSSIDDARRQHLVSEGTLRPGTGDASGLLDQAPISLPVPLSDGVVADRDDRL